MEGLGQLTPQAHEPIFNADWERRVFALLWAAGYHGFWNLDELRFAIERMPAAQYLETPYYEHWLHALETLLVDKGVIDPRELVAARGRGAKVPENSTAPMTLEAVGGMLANGFSMKKSEGPVASYAVGDHVKTKLINPHGHTRLPRYARGKPGIIKRDHGIFPFNDTNAHGHENPQHVYLVSFSARDIWGDDASANDSVLLDLWESHLLAD